METVLVTLLVTVPAENDASSGAVRPGAMSSSPILVLPQVAMTAAGAATQRWGEAVADLKPWARSVRQRCR